MSAKSTLHGMSSDVERRMLHYLREHGQERVDYKRLNLYVSRAAQGDNNPTVTWEEASSAAEAYLGRAPLTRLPGSGPEITFQLEDGTNVWGGGDWTDPKDWAAMLQEKAKLFGVEARIEMVPGSYKKASFWEKAAGIQDEAKYTVSLHGEKAAVERISDWYHERKYSKDVEAE